MLIRDSVAFVSEGISIAGSVGLDIICVIRTKFEKFNISFNSDNDIYF